MSQMTKKNESRTPLWALFALALTLALAAGCNRSPHHAPPHRTPLEVCHIPYPREASEGLTVEQRICLFDLVCDPNYPWTTPPDLQTRREACDNAAALRVGLPLPHPEPIEPRRPIEPPLRRPLPPAPAPAPSKDVGGAEIPVTWARKAFAPCGVDLTTGKTDAKGVLCLLEVICRRDPLYTEPGLDAATSERACHRAAALRATLCPDPPAPIEPVTRIVVTP